MELYIDENKLHKNYLRKSAWILISEICGKEVKVVQVISGEVKLAGNEGAVL